MRRWFNIVPFLYKPPNPDRQLEDKLRDEWLGILRWAIDGCLAWQRRGLVRAKVVFDATAEYFSEQDTFRQWIEDCCETGARALSETTGNLFHSVSGGPRKRAIRRIGYGKCVSYAPFAC
jgi:putative DNA primase/helicase